MSANILKSVMCVLEQCRLRNAAILESCNFMGLLTAVTLLRWHFDEVRKSPGWSLLSCRWVFVGQGQRISRGCVRRLGMCIGNGKTSDPRFACNHSKIFAANLPLSDRSLHGWCLHVIIDRAIHCLLRHLSRLYCIVFHQSQRSRDGISSDYPNIDFRPFRLPKDSMRMTEFVQLFYPCCKTSYRPAFPTILVGSIYQYFGQHSLLSTEP